MVSFSVSFSVFVTVIVIGEGVGGGGARDGGGTQKVKHVSLVGTQALIK
jgi:hypothetical protein